MVLRLRFGDFAPATRSRTLAQASASTALIHRTAKQLLAEAWPLAQERGLTRVGISVANLTDADAVQLAFDFESGPPAELDATVDEIRHRFGTGAILSLIHISEPTRPY